MAKPPKYARDIPDFNDMVDVVAGAALTQFVRGTPWREIVWGVAMSVVQWTEKKNEKKRDFLRT